MDESSELPALAPAVTYLRQVALESKELHDELRYAGFSDKQATAIVAQMISEVLSSPEDVSYEIELIDSDDDEGEDDTYDDDDGTGES